jgi:predicted ABC-type ATPase
MIARLNELVTAGESFAFETTCSGRGHMHLLARCRAAGYRITLIFLWLPSADIAVQRVARRVSQGGHRISDDVIVRRYAVGLRNMIRDYLPLADMDFIHDNSDEVGVLIAERRGAASLTVHDRERWERIEEAAR